MAAVVVVVPPFSSCCSPGQLHFVGKDIARLFHPLASPPFPSTGQNTWIDGYDSSCTKLSVQAPPTPPCFNWRSSSRTRVSFFQSLFNHIKLEMATANLVPLNSRRVAVKFDSFKIAGAIPIKAQGSGRGQLEITYLDEELRSDPEIPFIYASFLLDTDTNVTEPLLFSVI